MPQRSHMSKSVSTTHKGRAVAQDTLGMGIQCERLSFSEVALLLGKPNRDIVEADAGDMHQLSDVVGSHMRQDVRLAAPCW